MPTPKDKRDYHKEWLQDKKLGHKKKAHTIRAQARRLIDKEGIDRKGMHVAHKKAISDGGKTTKSNIEVETPEKNLHFKRRSDHTVKE